MGANNIIQDQSFRKHSHKYLKTEDCVAKAENPENIEIATPICLAVWLFWCEKGVLLPNLGLLASKMDNLDEICCHMT